ncbi:hypothetical protein NK6_352 [Bradyrhizobium diazoefficiens]|uniref:Uncharacterized protein n=1 Tax=Bradyrhizobium diazoefficiens TaxID=1355477 RepID=A0A0E4BJB4_9BRAD|nr:hypothetical protein NK6_352 [Bradyrhizobium diazoefficiens]
MMDSGLAHVARPGMTAEQHSQNDLTLCTARLLLTLLSPQGQG